MMRRTGDAGGHELVRGPRPHAMRTPDGPITVFEGEPTTYGAMVARATALAGVCTSTGSGPGTWSRCFRTTAPSSSRRCSPPTTSGPSPCRSTGGWRRPRCATSSSTPAPACWSATSRSRAGRAGDRRHGGAAAAGVHRPGARAGWSTLAELGHADGSRRAADGRRRRAPSDVHLGHDRSAQRGHAHPRQPGVEEPGPHRRVRVHQFGPRAWPVDPSTTSGRSTSRRRRSSPPAPP